MKDVNSDPQKQTDTETETQRTESVSPEPLSVPLVDASEINPQQGVNLPDEKLLERRKRRHEMRNSMVGMESVQEHSGEEGDGMKTPRAAELEDDSNKTTPNVSDVTTTTAGKFDWSHKRQHSAEYTSSTRDPKTYKKQTSLPKQPFSLPALLPHTSHPHTSTPPSSLPHTSTQSSLLSSLSSIDSRSLLSRQTSFASSISPSLAELLVSGSPTVSMPDELYQLMLLWNGIKTAITQKRERLERIRDLWKSFETKKEEFVNFLTMAEERLREFCETLGKAMDIGVIQNQIETQKVWE